MNRKFRPLLPAQVSDSSPDEADKASPKGSQSSSEPPPASEGKKQKEKRKLISRACENCRKRKQRCDGVLPTCSPCTKRLVKCAYAAVEPPTDKHQVRRLRQSYETIQRDNEQLRELLGLLRDMSRPEADDLLSRLRVSSDPITVLMQARMSAHCPPILNVSMSSDPRLSALNLNVLGKSLLRVNARPWTEVAEDGLVSELITSFFLWDDAFFYPFIDREAFLSDMRSGDLQSAKYCSPFLVNAICALRCFTSHAAKAYHRISGDELGIRFLNEAKKILDMENGRASLPTVQGLTLLFSVSAYRGADRAGMMYRYAAYEMLRRLSLENVYRNFSEDPHPSKRRQAEVISKALWGLFCFESIVAWVYLQQSLLPPPKIPRHFPPALEVHGDVGINLDLFGNAHTEYSNSPPFIPGTLHVTCELVQLAYEVMGWNADPTKVGTTDDISKRHSWYKEALHWRGRLPRHFCEDVNFTPQTCFLRAVLNEILLAILRPLNANFPFYEGVAVKTLCIHYTSIDVANIERYVKDYGLNDYSCMVLCGLYNSAMTLVYLLDEPDTHIIFAKACALIRRTSSEYALARYILQAVQAIAWSLNATIPECALPYLSNLGGTDELRDLPIAFVLPQTSEFRRLLSSDEEDLNSKTEIGLLLSKWCSLSS